MTVMYILTVKALYTQGKSLQQIAASSPTDNGSLYGLTYDEFSTQLTLASARDAEHSSYDLGQGDNKELKVTMTLASARQHERYSDYDTKQITSTADSLNATITLTNVRGVENTIHHGGEIMGANNQITTRECNIFNRQEGENIGKCNKSHIKTSQSCPNIAQHWKTEKKHQLLSGATNREDTTEIQLGDSDYQEMDCRNRVLPDYYYEQDVHQMSTDRMNQMKMVRNMDSWNIGDATQREHTSNASRSINVSPDVNIMNNTCTYLSPTKIEQTLTPSCNSLVSTSMASASSASNTKTTSRYRLARKKKQHYSKATRHNGNTSSSAAISGCRSYANSRRAVKVLGILFAVFIVFYLPFFATYLINATCMYCQHYISSRMITIFEWLAYSASMINPIIYHIFNPDFRRAFYKIIACQYQRK